jgi:hypothetical protein
MSFERVNPGVGAGGEPGPAIGRADASDSVGITPALRLQILSTEHWSLLASRSLAWNETFSRAGMFLSTLSGAIVALALASQAADFGSGFVWFALLILPVVLFIGVTTFLRQGGANYHDAFCVVGMNRIRAAYFELAPDLERYFVTSGRDDVRGMSISMGTPTTAGVGALEVLAGTPTMVAIINAVIGGAIAALVGVQVGALDVVCVVAGIVAFAAVLGLEFAYAVRSIAKAAAALQPMFPSPETD